LSYLISLKLFFRGEIFLLLSLGPFHPFYALRRNFGFSSGEKESIEFFFCRELLPRVLSFPFVLLSSRLAPAIETIPVQEGKAPPRQIPSFLRVFLSSVGGKVAQRRRTFSLLPPLEGFSIRRRSRSSFFHPDLVLVKV